MNWKSNRLAPVQSPRRAPVGLVGLLASGEAIVLAVFAATLLGVSAGRDIPLTTVIGVFGTVSFVTVGGFLVVKLSGHVVGWLLWTSGLLLAISLGSGYVASAGLSIDPGSIPGAVWFAWLSNWTGGPGLLLASGVLPLYFPSGRLLTERWQPIAVLGLGLIGLDLLAGIFAVSYTHLTLPTILRV